MADGTIFALPEFKPYHERFLTRVRDFTQRRRYYDGTVYDDIWFKRAHKLYAETRSLFSFLARAVDLDVALVPGVMGPWQLAEGTPQAIRDAQQRLYEWSEWDITGDEWMEDGATLGEALLKVIWSPEQANMVKLARLKPETAMLIDRHVDPETGQVGALLLTVDKSNYRVGTMERYEYGEAITPAQIRTYRDGEPFGYGDAPDRFANPFGFVPAVRTKNDAECRPTFSKATKQIDAVNELASYVDDIIGRYAEPQWFASGVEKQENLERGDNVWFAPNEQAKLNAIVAELDVPGSLEFIREVKLETKANLPELAFDDLRAKDQIATETLKVQLIELRAKIWKMRRRYDRGLVQAHQMSAQAAMMVGIADLAVLLAPHRFDYRRSVLPESRLEQIRLEEAELSLELLRNSGTGDGMTQAANKDMPQMAIEREA